MTTSPLGAFEIADAVADDTDCLKQVIRNQGYLFFRNVLDAEEVLRVKSEMVGVLQKQGIVRSGVSEPIWSGAGLDQLNDDALYALESYQELCQSDSLRRVVEKVYGEPVFLCRNSTLRYALPNDESHLTPPHQDYFFLRESTNFVTAWIPLMEIDLRLGGLAVAVGSHQRGLLEHVEHEGVYSYVLKGRKQKGVPLSEIDAASWLTTNYFPGDLLLFHSLMVHRALPNRSDVVRLSVDMRCQPASAPKTFQSQKSILGLRDYRNQVRPLAFEAGATEEQFEILIH